MQSALCAASFAGLLCGHQYQNVVKSHLTFKNIHTHTECNKNRRTHASLALSSQTVNAPGITPKIIIIITSVNRLKNDFTLPFSLLTERILYFTLHTHKHTRIHGAHIYKIRCRWNVCALWTWLSNSRFSFSVFSHQHRLFSPDEVHFLAVFFPCAAATFSLPFNICPSENHISFSTFHSQRVFSYFSVYICTNGLCIFVSLGMLVHHIL